MHCSRRSESEMHVVGRSRPFWNVRVMRVSEIVELRDGQLR